MYSSHWFFLYVPPGFVVVQAMWKKSRLLMQAGFWGVSPNYSSHFFSNGSKAMQSKGKAEETTTEHVRHHARVVYAAWIENVLIHFKRLLNSLKSSCTIKSFTYVTKGPFHSRTKQSTVHCENNYLYRSLLWLIRAIIWTGFDIALTQCKKLKSISGRCFTWYLLAMHMYFPSPV